MNHVHVIVSYWKYIWDRTEDHLFEYCMDWKVWFTVLVTKQLIHATKPRLITSSSSQTWILVKCVWIRNKHVWYYLNIWSSQIYVLTPNTILIWLKCICDLMTDCIGVFVYPANIWLDIGQSAYVSVWSDSKYILFYYHFLPVCHCLNFCFHCLLFLCTHIFIVQAFFCA